MEYRNPLRDLTVDNITSKKEEILSTPVMPKSRMSVIKAFDPLYESPHKTLRLCSIPSCKSICKTSLNSETNPGGNDENSDPMYSELVDLSEAVGDDVFDIREFIEDIIGEAVNGVLNFAMSNDILSEVELWKPLTDEAPVKIEKCSITEVDREYQLNNVNEDIGENIPAMQSQFLEWDRIHVLKSVNDNQENNLEIQKRCQKQTEYIELKSEKATKEKPFNANLSGYTPEVECKKQGECVNVPNSEYAMKEKELNDNLSQGILDLQIQCKKQDEYIEVLKKENTDKEKELNTQLSQNILELRMQCKKQEKYIEALKSDNVIKEKQFKAKMDSFDQMVQTQATEVKNLRSENTLATRHLSNLEFAFANVHQKYERSKIIIEGFKMNENKLQGTLDIFEATLKKYDDKLELIRQKASEQVNRLGKELQTAREEYQSELSKMMSRIQQLEIKNLSLTKSLEENTKKSKH